MIKLEQVSTMRLINYLKYGYDRNRRPQTRKEIEKNHSYEMLLFYNVTNYGQLKTFIESGMIEFQIDYLKNALLEAELALLEANKNGNEPVLYPTDNYEGFAQDRDSLTMTDCGTNGDVLLYGNIFTNGSSQRNALKGYSIHELKEMLNNVVISRCMVRGENAFTHNLREFDSTSAIKVRDAINFYERQVMRQATEYHWLKGADLRRIDLFSIDKDLKTEVTKEQIDEVILYLLDNAEECVWGPFTEKQKHLLDKSIHGSRNYEVQTAHNNLVEAISNYSTLGELETGLVRTRVINRFITK